jgi:hypothetical protein
MSEEIEGIEERLEKLKPLEQEALAAKILESWQTVSRKDPSPTRPACPPVLADISFASPRSCFASLSLCSACVGAIVGAAATFLVMTCCLPPKVETREIVREVRVKPEPATDVKVKPETKLAAERQSSSAEPKAENQSFAQPKAKDKFGDRLTVSDPSFRDLDALVAQQEALARQMRRYAPNADSTSSRFVPPRISPEEYRELLRELKL